jgi:adenylate cyclase
LTFWNLNPDAINLIGGKQIKVKKDADEVSIPVDNRGMMLINWGKPWVSFKHYSVSDVLSDAPDSSRVSRYKNKMVIVALSATGNTDIWSTPISTGVPGNQIQSFAINTILTQSFIKHVSIFPWIALFFVFLAIIFPIATTRLGLKTEAGLLLLTSLICISVEIILFVLWEADVGLVGMLLVFLPAALASFVIRGASLERQAAASRRALERYLAPELLDQAVSGSHGPNLSGRRLEVTIVFVDMQGFSTLSEAVDAEYVSRFLKNFFEKMSGAIIDHRGRIHQFLGDGFLAVFGDLVPLPDHAHEAVEAAIQMQKRMAEINAIWSNSGIKEFENGVNIRIGINTGIVFVGNLGSDRRLEYALVGSAVNIASRVQSLAPPGGILMTSRTKALWRDSAFCTGPQSVRLKGIDRETEVYTIEKVV